MRDTHKITERRSIESLNFIGHCYHRGCRDGEMGLSHYCGLYVSVLCMTLM